MTTYSFRPNSSTTSVAWHDPTVWAGGVVPNAPDADVDFPTVTQVSTGDVYTSIVDIGAGESFAVRSVDLRDYLQVAGSLTVAGQLTQEAAGEIDMAGGTLTAGTITNGAYDIQGGGHLTVDTLTNNTMIYGDDLVINATTLVNNGTLGATGGMTIVNVGNGGFAGFANGTLGGGTLEAAANATLMLNADGVIATDAATITLDGGTITSRDPATGQNIALTSSLREVAAGGLLAVRSGSYHFGPLSVAGTLSVSDAALFTADRLDVAPGAHMTAIGSVSAPIGNDGVIQVGQYTDDFISGYGGTLVLDGTVTGSGSIEILPGHASVAIHQDPYFAGPVLELAGKTSQNIVFDDVYGTLQLDRPEDFTGAISVSNVGKNVYLYGNDTNSASILLPNVDYSSIIGKSYVGDASGGTLTLQQASGAITLRFTGSHTFGNFELQAVPGKLSSDPSSIRIAITGHGIAATGDFDGDAHSDILWQNVNGSVSTWHATGSGNADGIVEDTYDARVDPSWTAVDSLDFNGDGLADILWRNGNGTIAVWDGTKTGFSQSSYVASPVPATTAIAGAGDFNGDGRDDLLFRNADGSILAEASNGSAFYSGFNYSYTHGPIDADWSVEGAADFTGDGKADILWRHANGSLSTWDATTASTGPIDFREDSWDHAPIDRSWHVVGLGDFDGDGKADILWRNDNGAVSVWTSTGDAGFAENRFNAGAATNWSVAQVGDFNGDGRADILWRNTAGQISIWHSTGAGWAQNTYSDSSVGTDWTIAAHRFPL